MTAPITGLYTKTITVKGPPTSLGFKPDHLTILRKWYRQRKPYNLPLAYSLDSRYVSKFKDSDPSTYVDVSGVAYGIPQDLVDNAYARAYARFVDVVKGETADLPTNFAEHRQSTEMITRRLVQLGRFTRAVKKFNWSEAIASLGLAHYRVETFYRAKDRMREFKFYERRAKARVELQTPVFTANVRENAKSFGNNWLEFHFGVVPLVNDIRHSMDILTSGLPPFRVKASAKLKRSTQTGSSSATFKTSRTEWYSSGWTLGAQVSVNNPNLWLANRLGLLNPLGLAWEVFPFSFIVDWFVNLNDVLKSFSEFYGLDLINPFRTELRTVLMDTWSLWSTAAGAPLRSRYVGTEYCGVGRTVGAFPGPVLRLRPAKALSWERGLTASALLVQRLKS